MYQLKIGKNVNTRICVYNIYMGEYVKNFLKYVSKMLNRDIFDIELSIGCDYNNPQKEEFDDFFR